jgi:hypothetical protein
MRRRYDPEKFTHRDVKSFLHNAQLASVENVTDARIPAVYAYKQHLTKLLKTDSSFSINELVAVLCSTAFDLYMGGRMDEKKRP